MDLPIMCFYGTFDEFRIGGLVAVRGRQSDEATDYTGGGCNDATNGNYTASSFAMVGVKYLNFILCWRALFMGW